jgi:glucose/arabinose dehydrogenase
MNKIISAGLSIFILSAAASPGALPRPDADDGGITLPPGFHAVVVADNLVPRFKSGALRFLSVAPNGDLYAKFSNRGLVALRDTNADGRADVIEKFGNGNGTGVLVRGEWLYYSTTTGVYRYHYTPGELVPAGEPQTIVSGLPDRGQHNAKVFAFDGDGKLLVEVGSPFNVLSDPDRQRGAKGRSPEAIAEFLQTHGGFWKFDPDKLNQTLADGTHFSTGHRHVLAVAWQPASSNFFACMMGRDNLDVVDPDDYDALDNAERDAEEFHLLKPGVNLGWPTTYWDPIKNARMVGPEYGGDNRKRDDNPAFDKPLIAFPAHWAPLQMCRYNGTQFPEKYRGGMFLAFHGSWNRAPRPQAGYKVVFIPFDEHGMPAGKWEDFAEGFPGVEYFTNTRDARYRPGGVAVGPDGSLYIGETEKGRIWRVIYTGETNSMRAQNPPAVATGQDYPPVDAGTPGGKFYAQVCAACHMPNGGGVPSMQPALAGSKVVAGDSDRLINVLLKGPAAVLPPEREKFSGAMPPFNVLNDADLASLINYLRANFAPQSPKITPEQVATQRAKL